MYGCMQNFKPLPYTYNNFQAREIPSHEHESARYQNNVTHSKTDLKPENGLNMVLYSSWCLNLSIACKKSDRIRFWNFFEPV